MGTAGDAPKPGSRANYLEALGIDVWVRREAPAPDDIDAPEATVESGTVTAAVSAPRSHASVPDTGETGQAAVDAMDETSPVVGETVSFVVRGFRLGQVLTLIDEPWWRHRRFFLDVANAMNGWRSDGPEEVRFEWPQLPAADSGMAAAGRAFRAFAEAQSDGGVRILAVGARVAELLGSHFEGRCLHVARTASGSAAFDGAVLDAAEKRDLWQRIVRAS